MAGYSVMISSYLPTPITCSIQSAVQRALCHFWMWYWQVHQPDHPLRKAFFVPSFWRAIGRQLPAFSCFRVCLSCRESFQPRSCPSLGSLHPVIDCGEDRRAQPFLSYNKTTVMGVCSGVCTAVVWGFVRSASHSISLSAWSCFLPHGVNS